MSKYNIGDLRQRQALPLKAKILLTQKRIREFYEHYDGKVYISFSGGKDSTVLLHIAREIYPHIKAVYCDTGLEFPEIKEHVKTFDDVDIIRPEKSFRQVIEMYGWVYPSKEVAHHLYGLKNGAKYAIEIFKGNNINGEQSKFKQRYIKWAGLANAPFTISDKCCKEMKKKPLKKYEKQSGNSPITGTTAEESQLRQTSWLRYGCNIYDSQRTISRPLSIWTEQDILRYIVDNNLKISSVYGEIKENNEGHLRTTGEDRTGCMFCLIGCHLEKGGRRRFVRMKHTHPQIYEYCMEQLKMREILDYIQKYTKCEPLYDDLTLF